MNASAISLVNPAVTTREVPIDLSVVCPFFNEEAIIEEAIDTLLRNLHKLPVNWELIVVNDGSTDNSAQIAQRIAETASQLRVFGYHSNRGRGHALRTGISQARGQIIVTTEIDLSWGEDIVERLYQTMRKHPDADIVVASPHLPGGGYRNVPVKRVWISHLGNWFIRACMSNALTMTTGMTRAYRSEVIRSLPLDEDGKEFHLEVVLKAQALHYRFHEIPAVLQWRNYKHKDGRVQRRSSSDINRLIITHSLFSLFSNPIRYVWGLAGLSGIASLGFLLAGLARYALGLVSVFVTIIGLALAIIALMLFTFGVIAEQIHIVRVELWRMRRLLLWND